MLTATFQLVFNSKLITLNSYLISLFLQSISVLQFKNYVQQSYTFTERIVGISGRNGVGKTNLLDAIHYLCFTKSYFSRSDAGNVHHGLEGFRIEGHFLLQEKKDKAVCILRENGRKEFAVNDEAYSKFSKHIGRYPCVVIAPDDVALIIGNSEERRKFLDTILSQFNPLYLQALVNYTKILQQRNSFLRSLQDGYARDFSVLDVLDDQLIKEGDIIYQIRKQFAEGFLQEAGLLYQEISERKEAITLRYESEMHTMKLAELLRFNRQKDMLLQRTSGGIHRDDLAFQLNGQPFKNIASQGQRKSLLFALKLSEMDVLKKEKGFSPLLLLDDVFEKLDDGRIHNLLARVCKDTNTQIFITDTNGKRLQDALAAIDQKLWLINLS